MRAPAALSLVTLLALGAGCGGDAAPEANTTERQVDGFLRLLPAERNLVLRLPPAKDVEARPAVHAALLATLGRASTPPLRLYAGLEKPDGLDADRGPGYAIASGGAWYQYLPAADKSRLNRALSSRALELSIREEGPWVVLSAGGTPPSSAADASPLPPGDLALRVHHHPLLSIFGGPGDVLEAGLTLGEGGIEVEGDFRPAEGGENASLLARCPALSGGLIDTLPPHLAFRMETTLPAAQLAPLLARQISIGCGMKEQGDRVLIERLLREGLTALDSEAGWTMGVEFLEGQFSAVLLGRIAPGPPSPLLSRIKASTRWPCGAFILDAREVRDLVAYRAWVAQAEPALDGLPEAAWPLVGALAGGEETGLPLAWAEEKEWAICAVGPRADTLVRSVRRRLAEGSNRSPGSRVLLEMSDRGKGDYFLGVTWGGTGTDGLPSGDRDALRTLFGAGPEARAPTCASVAAFRNGNRARLFGRILYDLR